MRLSRKPLLLVFACALAALTTSASPRPAPATTIGSFGVCPACTSATRCELINGNGSTGCSVKAAEGCVEEMGICVCGNCGAYMGDTPENRLERETPFGRLALHPVGDHRYAAWTCSGELLYLAERKTPDGLVTELPVAAFRDRYSYQQVPAAANRAE